MEKKTTKKDNFNAIIEVLEAAERTDLADVIRHEIELLDNKANKAKAKAATKKAEGDALTDAVKVVLTDEPATIADITEKVEFDGKVSIARVQYRLNQLVKIGYAKKEQVKVGEGEASRKLMTYSVVTADAE